MILSLNAEIILTQHRLELQREFELRKSLGEDTNSGSFETRLRQRMLNELTRHVNRNGKTHNYYWERLRQHATPKQLAGLIDEAQGDAGIGDHNQGAAMDDGTTTVEPPQERPSSQEIGLRVARLLGSFRGQRIGIEAKHANRDEHAILTPDPDNESGARVMVYGPHGVMSQSSHPSPSEALSHMATNGYTEPAPGSYAERCKSDNWNWLHQWSRRTSAGDEGREEPDARSRHNKRLTEVIDSYYR